MAKNRNRNRRPGRRTPFREPKPLILIVCEGKNTEPQYFKGFRDACENSRVYVTVKPDAGAPQSIVEIAKALKEESHENANRQDDENIRFEQVWCVFDVDEHPNLGQALEMARDNELRPAVSNESFELWLLLHFRENPGMKSRHQLRKMLEDFVPGYDKSIEISYYLPGYMEAVRRSQRMWQDAKESGENWARNPVTNVHELTESIRGESDLQEPNA